MKNKHTRERWRVKGAIAIKQTDKLETVGLLWIGSSEKAPVAYLSLCSVQPVGLTHSDPCGS